MKWSDLITEAVFPRKPSAEMLSQAAGEGFDISKLWFHGSRKRFDVFQASSKSNRIDELGPGIYLTSVKWLANTWARQHGVIVICLVREGPLFDLDKVTDPANMTMLRNAFIKQSLDSWVGNQPDDAAQYSGQHFDELIKGNRSKNTINHCLAAAGYVGAFKHNSQIQGQIVVFDPQDIKIIARQGGRNYMTSDDD